MPRGRPARSIEQRQAEGSARPDRYATTPIVSGPRRKPKCPRELTGRAADCFKAIVADLWPARILDRSDTAMVATAAMFLSDAYDAQDWIDEVGVVHMVTKGARDGNPGYKVLERNPAVKVKRDALAEFRQCCDLLGIGPSARARLANMGMRGAKPAQALPGVGAKPTPLRAVPDDGEE